MRTPKPIHSDNFEQEGELSNILPFASINRTMLDLGGKAANLGEMTRAGLPVQPGFCITIKAYALVAAGANLSPILAELALVRPDEVQRLEKCAINARKNLLVAAVPDQLVAEIRQAYHELGNGQAIAVAVRSSGRQKIYLSPAWRPACVIWQPWS